jgi:hypothetical protein
LRGPLAKRLWGFHDTTLGPYVRFAYHALAIDERRGLFKPTLWEKKTDAPARQKLQQVWFAGVHSDVGGGYRDPSLSEIPLVWMTDRARECGLAFRPDYLTVADDPDRKLRTLATHIAPNPLGELHDSRPRLFRRLPGRRRPVVDRKGLAASAVASSARQRLDEMPDYAAPNLEEYLSGKAPTVVEWSTQQRVAGIERGPRPAEPDAYAA